MKGGHHSRSAVGCGAVGLVLLCVNAYAVLRASAHHCYDCSHLPEGAVDREVAVHLLLMLLLLLLHIMECGNPEEYWFCQLVSTLTVHSKSSVPEICHIFHILFYKTCKTHTPFIRLQHNQHQCPVTRFSIQRMNCIICESKLRLEAELLCVYTQQIM